MQSRTDAYLKKTIWNAQYDFFARGQSLDQWGQCYKTQKCFIILDRVLSDNQVQFQRMQFGETTFAN